MTSFGRRLRQLIDEKQVSQKQLADELNIAISTLNDYIQDYREPDFIKLNILANYFSVSCDYLIGRTELDYGDRKLDLQESELIRFFRSLTPEQQFFLFEQAKTYVKYNNKPKDDSL